MNFASFNSMQTSSCLACAAFLENTRNEKCSCARSGLEHAFPKWWYHFLMGYKSEHTPHFLLRKEGNVAIIHWWMLWNRNVKIIFHPTYSLCCSATNGSILLFVVVYDIFHFKVFSCNCITFSPSAVTSVCLHTDYLFRLKMLQPLMAV